jgi:16S rRNA (cytosine967-C5)-methyltransferase
MNTFRETHLFAFMHHFEQVGGPLDLKLRNYFKRHKSLGSKDRRFIGDLVYALIRWKGLLDYLLGEHSPYAARIEQLRRLQNIDLNCVPDWVRAGVSQWMYQELNKDFSKEQTQHLCQILNEQAPVTLRANLLKGSREELMERLRTYSKGVVACRRSKTGIQLTERIALSALPEFQDGWFEIQDEGSQLIADVIQCRPGEQIFDYCSGSGGKSLALAPRLEGKGQIYLHDIRPWVLQEAKKRLKRARIHNAQCLPPGHPRIFSLHNQLDWVLIDVPCSGSGTLRRNPDMKWNISEEMVARLVKDQQTIFSEAVALAKPGGMIVYATCSLFSRENEEQVKVFLHKYELTLATPLLKILPEMNGPDGFFAAVFKKPL